MLKSLLVVLFVAAPISLSAQTSGPEVTSWILNPTHQTGYHGLETNVQKVQYSAANVYVSCTCIPGYDIGPWAGNPNQPANQNFLFKITRTPQQNTGTPIETPLGHIGVWRNGVSVFNAKDARSYNNKNIWHQNAIVVEGASFDDCLGHPAPNGEYHHHLNPICLYDQTNKITHSPIIGYAFDGFPIYGAYAFANTDGSGAITRMRTSYRVRSITDRSSLASGTLPAADQGPAISAQYPLGYYVEDFEYVAGSGDLDEHNGRFSITPEYPQGTYAYFMTVDESGTAVYPYTLGPTYYGTVPAGNTGPQSGHNTVSEQVLEYTGTASVKESADNALVLYPNPPTDHIELAGPDHVGRSYTVLDAKGAMVQSGLYTASGLDIARFTSGVYLLVLSMPDHTLQFRFVKQ
jgi:hypothetical protein